MKQIWERLIDQLHAGEAAVLVTVVRAKGSTPRGAGARMLVLPNRETMGTIGGGRAEYLAAQQAMELFGTKGTKLVSFGLSHGGSAAMTCGGDIDVLMQHIAPTAQTLSCYEGVAESIRQRKNAWLAVCLEGEGETLLARDAPPFAECGGVRSEIVLHDGREYYVERVSSDAAVYVFGGGHVGQEVVPMLSHLGFYTILIDPRKELANTEVFPQAKEIRCIPYAKLSQRLCITQRDYVIVMTHTHQTDAVVMEQVLRCRPCYLGMMGSRKKIDFLTQTLKEAGYTQEELDRCHMPIGLPIGAQTPAEIAVSIAGEIIEHRAKYWS